MSAYKRYMILHGMLAVLGVFMIGKADRLSDTPIAFVVIGLFCIAVAAGKMVLLKKTMQDDVEEETDSLDDR